MRTFLRACPAAVAALVCAASAASGQRVNTLVDLTGQGTTPQGWSLTPGLVVSRTYDDNVLLHGPGDSLDRDYINIINPRGEVTYVGPQATFAARYDGSLVLYNSLSALNSFDHRATLAGRRKLSKRQSLFMDASATKSATTELIQITGVPFIRTGAFTDSGRVGLESALTGKTTTLLDVRAQQARFDETTQLAGLLLGGDSIGAGAGIRHRISTRTTLTADADVQHALIGSAREPFNIQHATAGIDRQLSSRTRVFAAGGVSRLGDSSFGAARTGPSWRLGLVHQQRATILDVSYSRSFVPSFGFGGTMQSEEVSGRVHLPITRRFYTNDLVSWRRDDPLVIEVSRLRSVWVEAVVGYAARPWLRIEGFFNGSRQTTGQPNGLLSHNQIGIQVIANTPLRIQ